MTFASDRKGPRALDRPEQRTHLASEGDRLELDLRSARGIGEVDPAIRHFETLDRSCVGIEAEGRCGPVEASRFIEHQRDFGTLPHSHRSPAALRA